LQYGEPSVMAIRASSILACLERFDLLTGREDGGRSFDGECGTGFVDAALEDALEQAGMLIVQTQVGRFRHHFKGKAQIGN
jgi:hypothetical protein